MCFARFATPNTAVAEVAPAVVAERKKRGHPKGNQNKKPEQSDDCRQLEISGRRVLTVLLQFGSNFGRR
jgi:hypothetical protein